VSDRSTEADAVHEINGRLREVISRHAAA
jgi:hypothetical protein